ncbi:alpha-hydroxy-acid oxidizing protein [Amphibacillus cookii]|uniref:alpha-hydroxy-acid oxidizing protein n=1 Tax=Amphibacillus cookii TaxID=767787 RepID=UPI00195D9733|nr:isopentenyl diphosphate isomerase/L-lactate dehydrogenase-like FMN-dependent dehydrogenase [Amphibacillus cookii]
MTSIDRLATNYPFSYQDWELRCQEQLDHGPFGYVRSGSGAETTLGQNDRAFERLALVPKVLKDVIKRDLSISLFNRHHPFPFLMAPVGFQAIIHPEGEKASARAARDQGVPYIASTVSSTSIEEISDIMGDNPHYFQLYWPNDQAVAESFIKRAEAVGYHGIVVTVDTPFLGWREVDMTNQYFPMQTGEGIANFMTDPVFNQRYNPDSLLSQAEIIASIKSILFKQNLTWENIKWLQEITDLPIILKGILHLDDAKQAAEIGVDGIIVSNHGGRQLDGVISGLEALPAIVEAVQDKVAILVDGGIRRGTDILKAFALGANGVLLGRPYVYGLIDGQYGVTAVLNNLIKDLDTSLAIVGVNTLTQLNRDYIKKLE